LLGLRFGSTIAEPVCPFTLAGVTITDAIAGWGRRFRSSARRVFGSRSGMAMLPRIIVAALYSAAVDRTDRAAAGSVPFLLALLAFGPFCFHHRFCARWGNPPSLPPADRARGNGRARREQTPPAPQYRRLPPRVDRPSHAHVRRPRCRSDRPARLSHPVGGGGSSPVRAPCMQRGVHMNANLLNHGVSDTLVSVGAPAGRASAR
jgi:hypothetical protein